MKCVHVMYELLHESHHYKHNNNALIEVKWVTVNSLWVQVLCTLWWAYTEGTWLYCDYFIGVYLVLFVLICTLVVLNCFVMCVCVCVCVCARACVCIYFESLRLPWLSFFLSCKANARVYFAKTGHCQHSSKSVICVILIVIRVVLLLIVMFYVLFMCKCVLPPGWHPVAVDKYIDIKDCEVLPNKFYTYRICTSVILNWISTTGIYAAGKKALRILIGTAC
jgi:hypothetical protein